MVPDFGMELWDIRIVAGNVGPQGNVGTSYPYKQMPAIMRKTNSIGWFYPK